MNVDFQTAIKELFVTLKALHPEMDAVNMAVLAEVDKPTPDIRSLFPILAPAAVKVGNAMLKAMTSVDWEDTDNDSTLLVSLLSKDADLSDIPEDLRELIKDHQEFLKGSDADLTARLGADPISAVITMHHLDEEFEAFMTGDEQINLIMEQMASLANEQTKPLHHLVP